MKVSTCCKTDWRYGVTQEDKFPYRVTLCRECGKYCDLEEREIDCNCDCRPCRHKN